MTLPPKLERPEPEAAPSPQSEAKIKIEGRYNSTLSILPYKFMD